LPSLFISNLLDPSTRFIYFAVIFTVVVSIVLHELAHGWMAIKLGDNTPNRYGRMTGNPLVHMGPYSLVVLFLMGIAWGQMPIDPTRLRGKFGEAKVAFAGPAVNLMLAFSALVGLGLWWRLAPFTEVEGPPANGLKLLFYFGYYNILLFIFNMMPIPPLDGSHILANFSRGYANLTRDPANYGTWMFGFVFVFMAFGIIAGPVMEWVMEFITFVAGDQGWLMVLVH